MGDEGLFVQYDFCRAATIEILDGINSEKQADVIPTGYNNSLRWNLGHIAVAQERVLYGMGLGEAGGIQEEIQEAFRPGTSPKEWSSVPLTLKEIRELLVDQQRRVKESFAGELEHSAVKPFKLKEGKLEQVGDLFAFVLWHEGLHQGVMKSMKRSIQSM